MSRAGLICACVAAVGGTARADNREQARVEFTAGQAADHAHDYVNAIQHYLRAIELVPHPFTLYNIAEDYVHLGKLRDAASYFRRYADGEPDAPDHAKTLALIAELEAKAAAAEAQAGPAEHRGATGSLAVTAEPPGALISVDGAAIGLAPSTLELEPGAHHVQLTSFGYAPFDADVQIHTGVATEVTMTLVRDGAGAGSPGEASAAGGLGVFAGGGAGVDAGGAGGLGFGAIGARYGGGELAVELGGTSPGVTADALLRYNAGRGRAVVFAGVGYGFSPGSSFAAEAGLRIGVWRGEHARLDLRASARLRYQLGADGGDAVLSVPLLVSLEAATR